MHNSLIQRAFFLILIVATFSCVAFYKAGHPDRLSLLQPDMSGHLGAEYDNIARRINAGQGFSDPFNAQSGPTAWMPPTLAYFLAAGYWIFNGDRNSVINIMMTFQLLIVLFMTWIVVDFADRIGHIKAGYAITVGGLLANFHALFQFTHDSGLLLLVNCLIYVTAIRTWRPNVFWYHALGWGILGGFAALCSPVSGAVWFVLTVLAWFIKTMPPARRKHFAFAVSLALLVITPWTIRNRIVLDRWIPIKSNGMFELWQAQCLSKTGLFDLYTASYHPWAGNSELRREYAEVGEINFIESKASLVKADIVANPLGYLDRFMNRLIAAFVYFEPFSSRDETNRSLQLTLKRIVFPLPLLSCYLILLFARQTSPIEVRIAISVWLLTLLPYVLVSYYERYAVPLLVFKLIIIVYAWSILVRWWNIRSQKPVNYCTNP